MEQLPYDIAVRRKLVVAEIALAAPSESRLPLLGVLYDVVAKTEWEEKSEKLGRSFDIASLAAKHSDDTLRRARALHDTLFAKRVPMSPPCVREDLKRKVEERASHESGRNAVVKCYKCGEVGHMSYQCKGKKRS